jgi:L-lysine 2,3-aminomutase
MRDYKTYTLQNYRSLPQISRIPDDCIEAIETVGRVFPFKTNSYVTERLIDWNNIPDDPIFTLSFPRREMLKTEHYARIKKLLYRQNKRALIEYVSQIRSRLNPHPSDQMRNVPSANGTRLEGMQHKYRETALLFPREGQNCFAFCSYCFRWSQFSGSDEFRFSTGTDIAPYIAYVKEHREITDILLTGGDPLTMNPSILLNYIEPFLMPGMDHVRTIRIGTKSLAYNPSMFTTGKHADAIISLFDKTVRTGKHLSIMAHFTHPVELSTDEVKAAIAAIRFSGAQIRTQAPVMKHINDDPAVWSAMWQRQVELGCVPYYMFVPRDTGARHFFELSLSKCHEIFRRAYSSVSGIARTATGPCMSTGYGKIQVLGTCEIAGEKVFAMRFVQGQDPELPAVPFFARYDAEATWIDQLKPAFGEKKFFFEL